MTPATLQVALHWVAAAFYAASFVAFANAVIFAHPGRVPRARWIAVAGLLVHAGAIAVRWIDVGHGPWMLKYEVFSKHAFLEVTFLVAFVWRRPGWAALGLVVLPVALLSLALGLSSNPTLAELPPSLRSTWLVFHIGFANLSTAAFLLSVATSVLQLLEWRPRPGSWMDRLPPRDALDAYTLRFMGFGLVFWTVAIAAGAVWANQLWGRYWGWDPIETWALVSWLVYGTLLHLRFFFRLKPLPTAWGAIACFVLFLFAQIVMPFIDPSMHSAYLQ